MVLTIFVKSSVSHKDAIPVLTQHSQYSKRNHRFHVESAPLGGVAYFLFFPWEKDFMAGYKPDGRIICCLVV